MQVHVAFTPDEAATAPRGIVVDVLCAEIEQARALRGTLGDALVGAERKAAPRSVAARRSARGRGRTR